MITGAIMVNSILKLSVLHNTIYRNLFRFIPCLHLAASTTLEHAVFVFAVILGDLHLTYDKDCYYVEAKYNFIVLQLFEGNQTI